MLHRSFSISPKWNIFTNHLKHTRQLLSNNNFPMKLIDDTINKFINNKFNTLENTTQISNDIKLYFKNQMTNNYKNEEYKLRKIISKHVKPVNQDSKLKLKYII